MKKIIVVSVIVVASIMAVLLFRNRSSIGFMSQCCQSKIDLVVVNDSADTISTEYKKDEKEVAQVIKPGENATGGQGFIRIFTAKKPGAYELSYPYPRPDNAPQKVSLSEIVEAANRKNLGEAVYTEKGMIGDIKVEYEEVRIMSSVY